MMKKCKTSYKAEIEAGDFKIILADNDADAIRQYFELGETHKLYNLIELDENYDELFTIL